MKTITLNILAEDIKTTDFTNARECAISRSLRRSGLEQIECGGSIGLNIIDAEKIRTPEELMTKVKRMYKAANAPFFNFVQLEPLEPQDFTYSLEVPDNW